MWIISFYHILFSFRQFQSPATRLSWTVCLVHSPSLLVMKEPDNRVIILWGLTRCFWKQATDEVTITTLTEKTKKKKPSQQYNIMTADHILTGKSRSDSLAFSTWYIYIISLDVLPLSATNQSSSKKHSLNFPLGSSGMTHRV